MGAWILKNTPNGKHHIGIAIFCEKKFRLWREQQKKLKSLVNISFIQRRKNAGRRDHWAD